MAKRSSRRAMAIPAIPAIPSCPCGLAAPYEQCCGRFHTGRALAPTAELLMRSRYSAFVVEDADYLLRTWHSSTRPGRIGFDADRRWSGLQVVSTSGGGMLEPTGTVEFRADYARRGLTGTQHEVSRFVREDGRWTYLGHAE